MAYRQRKTLDKDWDRLAENLHLRYGSHIKDEQTFLKAWYDYMDGTAIQNDSEAITKTLKHYRSSYQVSRPTVAQEVEALRPQGTRYEYPHLGVQKKSVKRARMIRTKNGIRYIDSRGRYVSVKGR